MRDPRHEPWVAGAKGGAWRTEGGIFVTYVQTGRHTSAEKDAWPIAALTGYSVAAIDPHGPDGQVRQSRPLRAAPGQKVFRGNWSAVRHGNRLSLRKDAPDCEDLLYWGDGSVAAGLRRLGKGAIVNLGVKFAHDRGVGNPDATLRILGDILQWAGVRRSTGVATGVLMSQFVSNNGLFDVWTMWNDHDKEATAELRFREGLKPTNCREIGSDALLPIDSSGTDAKVAGLHFAPWETRAFLTPRPDLVQSPLRWFQLQRNWWRGTADVGPPVPSLETKHALDLTSDWSFQLLVDPSADISPLIGAATDDSGWEKRPLGVVDGGARAGVRRALFRKRFTVPESWKGGRVALWMLTTGARSFVDRGRLFLDGREAWDRRGDGPMDLDFGGALRPGSSHQLAIEVQGDHPLLGVRVGAWLAYTPGPRGVFDLTGEWSPSSDALRFGNAVILPGLLDATMARRRVVLPGRLAGRNVVFHVATEGTHVRGLLVNGRWVPRANPYTGDTADFHITPYVRPGQENEFIIVTVACRVREVAIHDYDTGEFP